MDAPRPVLVADANVIIDYKLSDPTILRLASEHIAVLKVPTPVAANVWGWMEADYKQFGMQLVKPTDEQAAEAMAMPETLVYDDWCCYIIARDNKWGCLTNDKRLRRECKRSSISIMWGLDVLVELARVKQLSRQATRVAALALQKNSPAHYNAKLMELFERKLGEL